PRRNWRFLLVFLCAAAISGTDCPQMMNPNGNGNGNANINGNSDRFRLKVNWEGAGFGSSFLGAQIWAFIADGPTSRASGKYVEQFGVAHSFIRSANSPNRLFEIDVDAGKTVSIVVFEDAGKILNL